LVTQFGKSPDYFTCFVVCTIQELPPEPKAHHRNLSVLNHCTDPKWTNR